MKRLISLITVLALLAALVPAAFAAETVPDGSPDWQEEMDLSGQYYEDMFGDGSPYQVVSIAPDETMDGFLVKYLAAADTTLTIRATAEGNGKVLLDATVPAPAGGDTLKVETNLKSYPEFYKVEAWLTADDSSVFTYYDHTRAYQEFLAITPDDAAFEGQLVLNYGEGCDGTDNFIVVSSDVKVMYVDSLDNVEVVGGDQAALFELMDGAENDAYVLEGGENTELLQSLTKGDKLLILPRDDINTSKTMIVGDVEERASLFSEDETTFTVVPAEAEPQMEDFFDFVRLHVTVEADTDDLDTSTAEVEVTDVEIEDETAELFGTIEKTLAEKSKSFTTTKTIKPFVGNNYKTTITISDTFTLSMSATLRIDYKCLSLQKITARLNLSATNKFTFEASGQIWWDGQIYVGTIPVGSVSGINFNVPVYITYHADFSASFKYTDTQTAWAWVEVSYANGRSSFSKDAGFSTQKSIQSDARATARVGLKASLEAKPCIINLRVAVTGEIGLEARMSLSGKKINGTLWLYLQPSFSITWRNKWLAGTEWSRWYKYLTSFTLSKAVYYSMTDFKKMTDEQIAAALTESEGDGMAVTLESAEDLAELATYVNAGRPTAGIEFVLNTADTELDLKDITWTPIGTAEHPFAGMFDGGGRVLKNLTVTGSSSNVGLFGKISGAAIHDVALEGANVSGSAEVGALVGEATAGSRIYDIAVTGTVAGTGEVGGIVGRLDRSCVLNSYCTANVSGTGDVGGIAGVLACNETLGQIANCYWMGTVTAVESNPCGTIAGEVSTGAATVESAATTGYPTVGVTYCYYLTECSVPAVGGTAPDSVDVKAWAVTEAQAKGKGETPIANDGYANAVNLIDALNKWYTAFGAYREENAEIPAETPASSYDDHFNHWYQGAGNDYAYPYIFVTARLYPLTVYYVYEDGSEAFPGTQLWLAAGAKFDVDEHKLQGYHTNVDEGGYTGWMCPDPTQEHYEWKDSEQDTFGGIEYRIVYTPDTQYAGSGASLAGSGEAQTGAIYKIETAADLAGLAAYVNRGGNTAGVIFEQLADIEGSGSEMASIGSATGGMSFRGTYLGNDLQISGLQQPLFGGTDGATIRDLKLSGMLKRVGNDNNMPDSYAGLLVCRADDTTISNCEVTLQDVTMEGSAAYLGGVVGAAQRCVIDRCKVYGNLSGSTGGIGGIAGEVRENTRIVNCAVEATISLAATASASGTERCRIGGLVGEVYGATVENSYVTSAINIPDSSVNAVAGGLFGIVMDVKAANCYAAPTLAVAGDQGNSACAIVAEIASKAEFSNVFYLNNGYKPTTTQETVEGVESFSTETKDAVCEKLDQWVSARTSADYLTWTVDAGESSRSIEGLPIHGAAYESWLMNVRVNDDTLTYEFNSEKLGEGIVYLAVYSQQGRMLKVCRLTESGKGSAQVGTGAAYAKCFVLDEDARSTLPVAALVVS